MKTGGCAHPGLSGWEPASRSHQDPQSGRIRGPQKENYKSQHAPLHPFGDNRPRAPEFLAHRWLPQPAPRGVALPEVRCRGGWPSARAAMAVAGVAALLAALGGALWLAARRFVGSSVPRLHGGADAGLMRGKTVLITGANSGVGRATAAALLRLGARVIMGCRDRARAEAAAAELRRDLRRDGDPGLDPGLDPDGGAGELVVKELDLASLRSVRAFCREMLQVWSPRGRTEGRAGAGAEPGGSALARGCDLGKDGSEEEERSHDLGRLGSRELGGLAGPCPVFPGS